MHMQPTFPDHPSSTWGGAIAMDPGDSLYQRFLLHQAQLHVAKFPDAQGIAIDRFDWLNEYNAHADDGRTWIAGRPVRSLLNSYRAIIPCLARIFHDAGKVVFCNPHMCRLDLMEEIDGVYSEFGHVGQNLNMATFLTPFKPLLCWTPDRETVLRSPDAYFQRHLLMGAFPTAPFPGNDHTIEPDSAVDCLYLDYGHMFTLMHGRTWALLPGVVEAGGGGALANLFRCGTRIIVPVVMGREESTRVKIGHAARLGLAGSPSVEIWYPGEDRPKVERARVTADSITMDVPLRRGCAFIVITH